MKETYHINCSFGCFGIIAEDGYVIESAPIAKWTKGKNIEGVLNVYKTKHKAKITKIPEG